MNQNKILLISCVLLLSLLIILFIGANKQDRGYKAYIKYINELNDKLRKENTLLIQQLHITSSQRSEYFAEKDSLSKVIIKLEKNIKSKNKELSSIKDNYKDLELDSLIEIAKKRYEKDINSDTNNN